MGFIRRIYYLNATGGMLTSYMMQGNFVLHGQDWDYQYDAALQPYANKRNEVGCFEWTERNEEIEREFAESYRQYVDVSVTPHKLVFDYDFPPPPPPPPTDEEIYQAGGDAMLRLVAEGAPENV